MFCDFGYFNRHTKFARFTPLGIGYIAQYAKQKVAIFKPFTDKRYSDDYIVSHNKRRIKSISVNSSAIDLTTLNPTGFPYIRHPINFNSFPLKN